MKDHYKEWRGSFIDFEIQTIKQNSILVPSFQFQFQKNVNNAENFDI